MAYLFVGLVLSGVEATGQYALAPSLHKHICSTIKRFTALFLFPHNSTTTTGRPSRTDADRNVGSGGAGAPPVVIVPGPYNVSFTRANGGNPFISSHFDAGNNVPVLYAT